MALTLLEANKYDDGNVKRAAIVEMFATANDIVRAFPFFDIPGDSFTYNTEAKLPGVGFRGYNEGYTSSYGVINPEVEVLRIGGGELDVDKALIKTRGMGVRTSQEAMQIKAMSLYLADRIINGDSVQNPREFDGLRARVSGAQLLPANTASPSANSPLSIEALDRAIDQVASPNYLIMSKAMGRRIAAAARSNLGGDITIGVDDFGFRVTRYNDLPILFADYNHLGNRIIDFNEAGPGGGADSSSIYAVNLGDGYVTGLQNGSMEVTDLGEISSAPLLRTRVEWLVGLAVLHGRGVSRIWGIQDAPVTS